MPDEKQDEFAPSYPSASDDEKPKYVLVSETNFIRPTFITLTENVRIDADCIVKTGEANAPFIAGKTETSQTADSKGMPDFCRVHLFNKGHYVGERIVKFPHATKIVECDGFFYVQCHVVKQIENDLHLSPALYFYSRKTREEIIDMLASNIIPQI